VKFERYEVVPLKNQKTPVECAKRNAEFYGLFGIDKDNDAYAIGDFSDEAGAEFIRDALIASD